MGGRVVHLCSRCLAETNEVSRVAELEQHMCNLAKDAESAQIRERALREALERSRDLLAYYANVFGGDNFTDRHDDEGRCHRMVARIEAALQPAEGGER